MNWTTLVFILFCSLLFSAVVGWGFGWRHPARESSTGASILFLCVILFLSMSATAVSMKPLGPRLYGIPWLAILSTGLVVSLLSLAFARPLRKPRQATEASEYREGQTTARAVFGLFFWLLCLALLIVMSGYLMAQ